MSACMHGDVALPAPLGYAAGMGVDGDGDGDGDDGLDGEHIYVSIMLQH